MATATSISISANPNPTDENSQSSKVISFQSQTSPRGAPVQTLQGVKISRNPETLDSLMSYLSSCGINLLRIFYTKDTMQDKVLFLSCISIHGDPLIVIPPDNFTLQSGDVQVTSERPETKFVPDGVSKFFLQNVPNPLNVGFTFICNAGLQYFPPGKEESISYGYNDYEDVKIFLKLKKHYYTVVPTIEYSRLVKVERLNTLQIALEKLSNNENQTYSNFAQAILKSSFMPLMSSELELTLLVPPSFSLDADLTTIAGHILIGRFDLVKENIGNGSIRSFNQAGSQIELLYENDQLQGIKINDDTISVSKNRPTISKYNGLIFGIEEEMPRYEQEKAYSIPQTSDIEDIFTLFDLSKQSSLIDIVRQKIDIEEQNELLKSLNNFNNITEEVIVKSHREMKNLYKVYLNKAARLQEIFFEKEIPCVEPVCEIYEELQTEVEKANKNFKKRVEASGKLRFLLKEVELLMLELFKIQRELEVETSITEIQNPDY